MSGVLVYMDKIVESYQEADINFENMELKKLKKYALRGNLRAQNTIGDRYYIGDGVEKNYEEAFRWYKKAADEGYNVAQYNLGDMYYCGFGIEKKLYKGY
ncbi:tetratricopeptide repeat protein [Clostridium saccharobutylicum]|uniref:tetratricopeptide repeat protein n=1 Tax=Clostridium saccharobutylicum TaxID=169679 RepID=UPI0017DD1099|nr:hypothetical protein [Clostridium saccharobutylicum]MBA9011104.1 TPR repeat protein [Clostridium saccharobutylicum]